MGSQVHLELHKRISDVFTRSSHVVNPVLCFKKNYHLLAVEVASRALYLKEIPTACCWCKLKHSALHGINGVLITLL
ncbi:beta-1,3-galactosyltransferase 1 isoform X3 [Aquila chrysaetos chrysaetos]|uniref:beta-1,3-galactosyltransferase 1 isoform X3 n=1 Tax=Aquila chrysaetos chrysaetos TaxID=223781 RepID=UPI0005D0A411|nr:beta-1,3-galactosyltransferase 1 isoform X3 [Aquila chrysaetos chrysaetos]